ncbi:MAG: cation:proton antiporter [Gemmatimonadota bacterium]
MASTPSPLDRLPTSVQVVSLGVTLVLVMGVTWGTMSFAAPTFEGGQLTILTGFVLLAATLGGGLASAAGLPRLTGFLLVGILAGPSILGILPASAMEELHLIDDFALALIALLAGGELKVGAMRAQARPILWITLAVTVMVWVGMGAVVVALRPLIPFLAEAAWPVTFGVAALLGVWMANSSPDLTVAVIEETGAKGEFTDVVLGVTIVKDVLVIVLFTLTLGLVAPLLQPDESFSAHVFVELAQHVGGAAVVGALLGWVFSRYLGDEEDKPRPAFATFLFAYVLVVISARLHLELLLTAVAAGFVIENLSPAGDRMIRGIESVSVIIFAFFFAIAGADLDLSAIPRFWLAALLLFAGRVLFTWLGTRFGARQGDASPAIRTNGWKGLVSQGGVSLLLVLSIQESFPSLGDGVVSLAMAIIIVNILGGPILLKQALGQVESEEAASATDGS